MAAALETLPIVKQLPPQNLMTAAGDSATAASGTAGAAAASITKTEGVWERSARLIVPFMATGDFPHFFKEWAASQKSDCKPLLKDQLPKVDKELHAVAQDLLFSKEEIEVAAKKQGELLKMVGERCDLVAAYAKVMSIYKENDNRVLFLKRTHEVTVFATKHMLAVLATAFELQINSRHNASGTRCTFDVEPYKFEFLFVLHDHQMHILEYSTATEICSGSNGVVHRTLNLTAGIFHALKLCKYSQEDADTKGESAEEIEARKEAPLGYFTQKFLLMDEIKKLNRIAALGKIDGVQPPPYYVFDGIDRNNKPVIGFAGELYGIDLFDWTRRPDVNNDERLACCEKLINLLFEFHSKGIRHRDIKPQNLCISNASQSTEFVFVDWAFSETDNAQEVEDGFCHTPSYTSLLDLAVIMKLQDELKKADDRTFIAQQKPYSEKADVFALGVTLYAVLGIAYPYKLYPKDAGEKADYFVEDAPFGRDHLLKRGIPPAYVEVIATMVKQKAAERPNIAAIKASWAAAKAQHKTAAVVKTQA